MGCFSFKCKKCGGAINSDSFTGHHCTLFLLQGGKVIEKMTGQYDSYGRVFNEAGESVEWRSYPWSGVCDLMFDEDKGSGIAAVHSRCVGEKKYTPRTKSADDPNQGWGRYSQPQPNTHSHEVFKTLATKVVAKIQETKTEEEK